MSYRPKVVDPIVYYPPVFVGWGDDESGDSCRLLGNYEVEHYCPDYAQGTITRIYGAPGEPTPR